MAQKTFSGVHFGFRWTDDGWYEYDGKPAEDQARRARDAFARQLKDEGYRVRKYSLGTQLVSRGGIGSGHPHIELLTKAYGVEWG